MMTIAERQLVALGEHARVRAQRLFLQLALEDKKRSEVERILKRRAPACVRCESRPAGLINPRLIACCQASATRS